jgi:ATP/maltotriose-dependent transcriptional regulator MalT
MTVHRPLLLKRLDAALAYRVQLVLGTSRAADVALRRCPAYRSYPVAWAPLSAADNQPAVFLSSMIAAIRLICPGLMVQPARDVDSLAGMTEIANALAAVPDSFRLVLGNYGAIQAASIHASVALLVDYPPPELHLTLVAAVEPALPLMRWRARRQLAVIRLPSQLPPRVARPLGRHPPID